MGLLDLFLLFTGLENLHLLVILLEAGEFLDHFQKSLSLYFHHGYLITIGTGTIRPVKPEVNNVFIAEELALPEYGHLDLLPTGPLFEQPPYVVIIGILSIHLYFHLHFPLLNDVHEELSLLRLLIDTLFGLQLFLHETHVDTLE